jgi:hypothetical protein
MPFLLSILLRFTEDEFYENMQSTVGMDYKTKQVNIDGNVVKLAIWVCNRSGIKAILRLVLGQLYLHFWPM